VPSLVDWPVQPSLPLIPGHEGVGIVEQVGDGASHIKVGDRVAMPWLGSACGICEYCIDGWETLCEQQVNTGYGRDGAYAEYATANAAYVAKVPDGVDPLDAAPLACGYRFPGGGIQYYLPNSSAALPWIRERQCTDARQDAPSDWVAC